LPFEDVRDNDGTVHAQHQRAAQVRILQKGNRLSITPVDPKEYEFILGLL